MEFLVVKNSSWKNFIYLFGSLIFVSLGIFILSNSKNLYETIIGWSCIIFFGLCAVVFIKQIFDPRPRIVINRFGIFDRTLKIGIIEWQDIQYASLNSVFGSDFISIILKDTDKYLKRTNKTKRKLAQYNKTLGFEAININLGGVNVKSKEVFDLIILQLKTSRIKNLKNLIFEPQWQSPIQKDVVSDGSNDS